MSRQPDTVGPRRRTRPVPAVVALVGWLAFLGVGAALLHAVGGPLAPPPLTDPGALGRWLELRQPAEAAVAILRLVALAMAWYLLVATVLGVAARLVGARPLVRAVDAITVPLVRRIVGATVGASLTAAALAGTGGAALAADRAPTPATAGATMRLRPDGPSTPSSTVPFRPVVPERAATTAPTPVTARPPVGSAAPSADQPPDPAGDVPTMRRLPDEPRPAPGTGDPPVMRRLSPDGTDPATSLPDEPPPAPSAGDPPVMRRLSPDGTDTASGVPDAPSITTDSGATGPAAPPPSPTTGPTRPGPSTHGPAAGSPAVGATANNAKTARPSAAAPGTPEAALPATATTTQATWMIRPGDHFWAVAERVLADAWHRSPADGEVDPYWHALVTANRGILRDPGNPDLLFPGQVITIPPPPARPAR